MDELDKHSTNSADIEIPADMDGSPLLWDGNNAKILGLLFETNKYVVRKNLIQPFIKHGVSLVSNGRIAVPSAKTVPFVQGSVLDSEGDKIVVYSLNKLRPITIDERVTLANAGRVARGEKAFDFSTVPTSVDFPVNRDTRYKKVRVWLCLLY